MTSGPRHRQDHPHPRHRDGRARRRLLLGHGGPDPPPARRARHPRRLHRRRERSRDLPQPPRPRRGGRDRVRPHQDHVPRHPGVLLPDPRPVDARSPGQRHRLELPLGDLPAHPRAGAVARETIADVDASGLWPGKAVTTIEPEGPFWEAEPEHQDYLITYPNGYTCHFPRAGWVLPKRADATA